MSNPQPRRLNSLFGKRTVKERRPAGISRKRKKQFGFESLEARQVMSATPLAQLNGGQGAAAFEVQSFSSATPEGQLQMLANELYWQSLIAASTGSAGTRSTRAIPTDPYINNQWHLVNSGQQVGNPDFQAIYGVAGEDINVAPVWNMGYDGSGVVVAVLDSGIQLNHPDLASNVIPGYDAINPAGNGNPVFNNPGVAHGTAVAGLIGAVANNGIGGAGVAPGVTLVPIRVIDAGGQEDSTVRAFRYALQNGVDITNNSWGPPDVRVLAGPSQAEFLALQDSIWQGRNGLGMIHVWASGNGGAAGPLNGSWDASNYDGWANSRYTIAVTGIDHDGSYNNVDGTVTAYPEAGANVLVAAPTGSHSYSVGLNSGVGSGLVTTDLTGEFGYNFLPNQQTGEETDRDFFPDTDYTTRFNGTSAAAPVATGVIALMLDANPNLNWREVQEILLRSARQNDQFGIPTNGAGLTTQNPWITNQMPIFSDPDLFVQSIPVDPWVRITSPTLDPNQTTVPGVSFDGGFTPGHYVADPFRMTNGAGYTISQGVGVYGEQIGTGHGVIDAELAVKLAEQWHAKDQSLSDELTFTTHLVTGGNLGALDVPAAELTGLFGGQQMVVPGGIGGQGGFIAYWNEYFATDHVPFSLPGPPQNTRGGSLEFSVPDNNTMTIESVDVTLNITGNAAEAMEHLRILLVSPEGTYSELNNFWVDSNPTPQTFHQWETLTNANPIQGSMGSNAAQFFWNFNTNRSWGERSDDAIMYDPITGEPVIDELGFFRNDGAAGKVITQGWRIVVENWDNNDAFAIQNLELAWHGNPIAANTERISGKIGVDDNRDDLFNFNRVNQTSTNFFGDDPNVWRLGEVTSTVDLTQESFAANVTVVATRASDGVVVDRFVTGADGNYYFDLVPDDYIISIEDPEGRLAQDDAITPNGFLRSYKSEWLITEDYFKVWDKAQGAPNSTNVDANGTPIAWLDGNGDEQITGMKGINFLLDPGDAPLPQVVFSGVVYADANGDGIFNGNDIAMPNASIFADVNRNGFRDAGEIVVTTDANGFYNLIVPTTTAAVMNVGIVAPAQWSVVTPAAKLHTRYVTPGSTFSGLDFYIKPPTLDNQGGGGANQPGILMGVVYQDLGANPNGQRDTNEPGAPGFTVYIDANNNGVLDGGDTSTVTNQHGAYIFTNVAPGQRVVRVVAPSPFQTTSPTLGRHIVTLVGSGTFSTLNFGIGDTAILDYGDLPAIYGATTLAQNGARHKKGVYFLGSRVDGELNGQPTANADGDDLNGFDDDDGIVFDPLVPGSSVRLIATASRNNGYLKGWIDWNGDGDFDDPNERLVFSGIGAATNNVLLSSGPNTLYISVPAGVNLSNVYARFRYGELTINSIYGEAAIGEVEDYLLPVAPPAIPALTAIPADFNGDNQVDGSDFLVWQRNFGKTTGAGQAQGSANGDGDVDHYDLAVWKESYGQVYSVASLTSEEDEADAPQALAVELQSFGSMSEFASAVPVSYVTLRASAGSTSASLLEGAALQTSTAETSRRFEARPILANLADVAERLRLRADSLDERLEEGRGFVVELLHDVADRVEDHDFESVRRDRAFDDLFGSRRRQGLKVEVEAEAGEGVDADDAFAMFADHFEVPRG